MGTQNTVIKEASSFPVIQPTSPGIWINGGVLTFWDGGSNFIVDFNQGPVLDAFGVSIGIDL
jgi:hypothetical protein